MFACSFTSVYQLFTNSPHTHTPTHFPHIKLSADIHIKRSEDIHTR